MKQRVFGSHRTIGDELLKLAGPAAENFEAVYPFDPSSNDPRWTNFVARYEARYNEKPDHFAALAYDQMRILLDAICRAGLNRGRIRDALTALTTYKGVTGDMVFDPNCKNIAPLFLAHVQNGHIAYRRIMMEKPYARVGETGVQYSGPPTPNQSAAELKIGIFGPHAEEVVRSPAAQDYVSKLQAHGQHYSLLAIPSDSSWGKASSDLVKAVYEEHALALIALDRPSSHLAEQIAVKSFIPLVAISSDHALTSTNIPWIFRLPDNTQLDNALACIFAAIEEAGPNRSAIRASLASGKPMAGISFGPTGEARQ
jgi:substrate-binding family protein